MFCKKTPAELKAFKEKLTALLRISLGWIFFWGFIDKLFGLGFATEAGKSWLDGASPTSGFLSFGTHGPFAEFYQSLAGNPLVDWLFMLGLGLIGLSLILGIGMRVATASGALLMLLLWTAALPPEHNPLIDEHIVYILLLIGLHVNEAGDHYGLGKIWGETKLVKRFPSLK